MLIGFSGVGGNSDAQAILGSSQIRAAMASHVPNPNFHDATLANYDSTADVDRAGQDSRG